LASLPLAPGHKSRTDSCSSRTLNPEQEQELD
jgi:hypothetical protein